MKGKVTAFWSALGCGGLVAAAVLQKPERLLQGDAYLALVCGRLVARDGLPSVDTLASLTQGRVWVDEQWLGQLVLYATNQLGGPKLLVASEALVTGAAFAIAAAYACKRSNSFLAVLISAIAGLFFCGIFFGVRPQMFSLLLFAIVLALVGDEDAPVFWTLPLLVLWANLHGAVLVGAGLVVLRGVATILQSVQHRDSSWLRRVGRSAALVALAAATPFASPYAERLLGYFASIRRLQDPARQLAIIEWTPIEWRSGWLFFAIAGVMSFLVARRFVARDQAAQSRPNRFETAVLFVTALAAWRANRNVQWFGLALAAYAPPLLEPYFSRLRALPPRLGRVALATVLALVVALSVRLAGQTSLQSAVPMDALPALHEALLSDTKSTVIVTDDLADWALWQEPLLAGRLVFDVRFELLADEEARDVATFLHARPGWQTLFSDAKLALVSRRAHKSLSDKLAHLPGARILWENDDARLLLR